MQSLGDAPTEKNMIAVCMDIGRTLRLNGIFVVGPLSTMVVCQKDATIGDREKLISTHNEFIDNDDREEMKLTIKVLRLLACIGFLRDCPDEMLVEPDVLSKDKSRYRSASQKEKAQMVDRARRRRKVGWVIGTNEKDLGTLSLSHQQRNPWQGGEVTKSFPRRGHLRRVRHGKRNKFVKIKWIPPTIVRRDLRNR